LVPEPILPLLRAAVFIASAAPITAVDLKSSRIPDALSLGGLACLSLFDAFLEPDRLLQDCLAAALAFALFYGIRAFTMGLGFGDIKYAALVAFYTGIPYCFAAMAASALAALLAFAAVAAAGGRQRIVALPFAPFLTLGALAAAALEAAASGGRVGP
jgi:leader peptidase (prepilin peptidase) / N-methyltransferase